MTTRGIRSESIGDYDEPGEDWTTPALIKEEPRFTQDPYNVRIDLGEEEEGRDSMFFDVEMSDQQGVRATAALVAPSSEVLGRAGQADRAARTAGASRPAVPVCGERVSAAVVEVRRAEVRAAAAAPPRWSRRC